MYTEPEFFHFTRSFSDQIEKMLQGPSKLQVSNNSGPRLEKVVGRLNLAWRQFFSPGQSIYEFVVRKPSLSQRLLGVAPMMGESTVLVEQHLTAFKRCGLYGIESTLMILYLAIFVCFEMLTERPTVAGFIVFVFDQIVQKYFRVRVRHRISRCGAKIYI
jgi:hypothetical protein